jgi:uncharacterized protein (TIGR03663 family)
MKAVQTTAEKVPGTFFDRLRSSRSEKRPAAPCVFFLAMAGILAVAAALRLVDLGNRPMHCDEAVHGVKFGRLLEQGEYTYNPHEYHGPSLNYLTLPVAGWASAEKITQLTETHLRLVPALFGILLVGLPWLVREELGYAEAVSAAALTAVSPAMVFYSRYYIQEMLLVCFTFGAIVALWRYARMFDKASHREESAAHSSPPPGRDNPSPKAVPPHARLRQAVLLVTLGACIGMMHASKETFVIAMFAIILAATLTISGRETVSGLFVPNGRWINRWKRVLTPFCVVTGVAAGVSILFHSSFLTHPQGVADSLATYFHYFVRAAGEGSAGQHAYPWYHYFRLLFWWQTGDGPLWTEALIGTLAVVGLVASISGKGIASDRLRAVRFLSVYAVVLTLVYSALSYKTPWCALGFLHGMILLAGVGMAVLVRAVPGWSLKSLIAGGLAVAIVHLGWQAHRASFVDFEDVNNPYVYAHTTSDVPRLVQQLRRFAACEDPALSMHVQVICPDDDYWPLPWYMRDFSTVGWFAQKPQGTPAGVIIIQPGKEMESTLTTYLYVDPPPGQRPLYVPAFEKQGEWLLRPGVPLRVYVKGKLWAAYPIRDG